MLIHAMLIALIVRGKDIIKYRLISLDGQKAEVYDATENQIVTVIKNKSMDISNIRIQGGKVKGYGAKLNRYAQLNENGQLTSEKSPLVVINRIVKDGRVIGYKVSDYKGTVVNGKLDDVVNYAVKHGIANGKIVEKEGKKFISSILDEYSENEIKQPIINIADKAERPEKAGEAVSDTLSHYKTNQLVSSTENIGEHIKYIRNSFTKSNFELIDLVIPKNIVGIARSYIGTNIRSIKFEEGASIINISDEAFSHCKNLLSVDLSNCKLLKSLGERVFSDCPNLVSVILPDNLEKISFRTFGSCDNLSKINMPKSLYDIDQFTFDSRDGNKVEYLNINPNLNCIPSHLNNTIIAIDPVIELKDNLINQVICRRVNLPSGLKIIGKQSMSFGNFDFNVPEGLEYIGDRAFFGFKKEIVLDLSNCKSLKSIGNYSMASAQFVNVYLPDGLNEIGEGSFSGMINLKTIYIPKSVTKIGKDCLKGSGLKYTKGLLVLTQRNSAIDSYCKVLGIHVAYVNNSSEAKGIEKSSQSDTSINKSAKPINNKLDKKQTGDENRPCLEWDISCKLKKNKIKSLSDINITTYREIFKTAWFIGGRKYGKSLANSHYTEIDIKSCKIRTYKLEKDSLNAESLAKLQAMPGWNNSSKYVTFTTIEGNERKDKSVVNGYFSSMEIKSVVRALLSIQSKLSKDQSDLVRGQVNLSNYYIISEFAQNTISDIEVSYMVIGIGRKTGRCKLIAVREFIEDSDAITEAYEVLSIKDIRGLISCGLTSSYENNKFATLNTKKIYDMPTIFKYINDYDSTADNEISLDDIVNSDISTIAKAREIAIRKYINNMQFSGDLNTLLELSK